MNNLSEVEILRELLKESLIKLETLSRTPPDEIWLGLHYDFITSANVYLSTGNLTDEVYVHDFINNKGE